MNKFLKKSFLICTLIFSLFNFAFSENNIESFVKGNIADKTAAVRKATGNEAIWLSNKAITFVLESKEILGNDRELDGLAVATILAFPQDIIKSSNEQTKEVYLNSFINLFDTFRDSPTVQIAVISKVAAFKSFMNISPFVKSMNNYLSTTTLSTIDSDVVNAVLNFLSVNGDNESFSICYSLWNTQKYSNYNSLFENIILSLLSVSMDNAVKISISQNIDGIDSFFNLLYSNKSKINQNYLSEIAVNVLSNTILLVKNSQKNSSEITNLQIKALDVLSENKWTRASSVVLSFFGDAKALYAEKKLSDSDFVLVINSLNNVSPLEAVPLLVKYLGELNSMVEKHQEVSEPVVLAVINTLGAIGDKSAFDALLGVTYTYYNYPQSVLSAAREALSGLKW